MRSQKRVWLAGLLALGAGCSLIKVNGKPLGSGDENKTGSGDGTATSGNGGGGAANQVNTKPTEDGRPGWCKDYGFFDSTSAELSDFDAMKDPNGYTDNLITSVAEVMCATSGDHIADKPKIMEIRAAWMKRNDMDETDFVAAVAGSKGYGWDSQDFEKMERPFSDVKFAYAQNLMLEVEKHGTHASQLGKHNLVNTCFQGNLNKGEIKDVPLLKEILCTRVTLDKAKAFAEIEKNKDLNPQTRYSLRKMVHIANVAHKNASADIAAKAKADPGIAKLVSIADTVTAEWTTIPADRVKLVEQVEAMEAATVANKRSSFAGCEEKTRANWDAHIKGLKIPKIPSSKDKILDVIVPVVYADTDGYLAWTGLSLCAAGLDKPLIKGFDFVGSDVIRRGMFTATIAAWLAQSGEITFDDRSLSMKDLIGGQYNDAIPMKEGARFRRIVSGQIDKLSPDAKTGSTQITFKRVTTMMEDCVKYKKTNRISSIDSSGNIYYENICLQWGKVKVDITADPLTISTAMATGLKSGMYLHSIEDGFPVVATSGANSSKASWVMGVTL